MLIGFDKILAIKTVSIAPMFRSRDDIENGVKLPWNVFS
jgi:hypothetical protein